MEVKVLLSVNLLNQLRARPLDLLLFVLALLDLCELSHLSNLPSIALCIKQLSVLLAKKIVVTMVKLFCVKHFDRLLILEYYQNRLTCEVTTTYLRVSIVYTIHPNLMLTTLLKIDQLNNLIPRYGENQNCSILFFRSESISEVKVWNGFRFTNLRPFNFEYLTDWSHRAYDYFWDCSDNNETFAAPISLLLTFGRLMNLYSCYCFQSLLVNFNFGMVQTSKETFRADFDQSYRPSNLSWDYIDYVLISYMENFSAHNFTWVNICD